MSRKLRLKCPACQTLIETFVDDELRVTLQCAACHHQFTAKVPPRATETNSPNTPSHPVAARPVAARPVAAQPSGGAPTVRPVSARPVQATPAYSTPSYAPSSPPADPLFGSSSEFNFPVAPTAYQPVRKRKPLNLRPLLTIVGSIAGLVLAITLGLYGWHWAANTDWSTFSVMRDSPERILEEVYNRSEQAAKTNANMLTDPAIDYEQVRKRLVDGGKWAEKVLVRSVRLGKVPLALKEPYTVKMDALMKSNNESMQAKMKELKDAGRQPTLDGTRMSELLNQPAVSEAGMFSFAMTIYLHDAFYDLPQPTSETEKIYYEEANLVHDYLKLLTFVRNTSQSKTTAEKIEKLSDRMMDLATRRSKLPPNRFEQVPREYVSKDKGFSISQKALVTRIRRDANPAEKLKDAVANFNDARDLLLEASSGQSDVSLRTRFAEFRKIRSETTLRAPGDLFHEEAAKREMVVKPGREAQPDPVREPPQPEPKPQPSPDTLANNTPTTSITTPVEAAPAAKPQSSPANVPSSSSSVPSPLSPGLRDHFFRGLQAGMQEGLRGGPPTGAATGNPTGNPTGGARGGMPPTSAGPAPNFGPPVDGQGMVFPSQGFGAPGPGAPGMPPPLTKEESVKIIVSKTSLDGNELVKRLASSLESGNYSMSGGNGKITMQIKYTGELDRVVKLIDFGKVTLIDAPERTIHVTGN